MGNFRKKNDVDIGNYGGYRSRDTAGLTVQRPGTQAGLSVQNPGTRAGMTVQNPARGRLTPQRPGNMAGLTVENPGSRAGMTVQKPMMAMPMQQAGGFQMPGMDSRRYTGPVGNSLDKGQDTEENILYGGTDDPDNQDDPGESGSEGQSDVPGTGASSGYQPSDAVREAEELLRQHLENKPGEYSSEWQDKLNEILNQILNREKFSYDLNGDALYQQYKDQYMQMGQQAMMDTMGQAQAMTGGYGNSYAQKAGQQAYQGYLQQLNNKVPELYALALSKYNREGDALLDQYGMYLDRENQDYSRYRDSMSDYYADLERLINDARYRDERDYGRYRDTVEDDRWQKEYDQRYGSGGGYGGSNGGNDMGDSPDVQEKPDTDAEEPLNYWSVSHELDQYIKNGATQKEIQQYLQGAYRSGYITYEEYQSLLKGIRPVGLDG